jgi:hypothetical protein
MHALERVSGCPRIVRVLSTNSRTGRPPCLGVDRARVLDVRIFVKISEPGDPDPISFLTKILTSKTRARSPVRKRGSLVHKVVDTPRTIHGRARHTAQTSIEYPSRPPSQQIRLVS